MTEATNDKPADMVAALLDMMGQSAEEMAANLRREFPDATDAQIDRALDEAAAFARAEGERCLAEAAELEEILQERADAERDTGEAVQP
jgi:hypothetical protein